MGDEQKRSSGHVVAALENGRKDDDASSHCRDSIFDFDIHAASRADTLGRVEFSYGFMFAPAGVKMAPRRRLRAAMLGDQMRAGARWIDRFRDDFLMPSRHYAARRRLPSFSRFTPDTAAFAIISGDEDGLP